MGIVTELKPAHVKARKTANTITIHNVLDDLESLSKIKFPYHEYITREVAQKVLTAQNHIHNAIQSCKKILDLLDQEVKDVDVK